MKQINNIKLILVILTILISNEIAYSQEIKLGVSPKSIDFGTISLNSSKEVPVCITNKGNVNIFICTSFEHIGIIQEDDHLSFLHNLVERSQAVFTLKPNEKLEFSAIFFPTTVGQKSGMLELLAGRETDKIYDNLLSFVTDTIRVSLIGNGTDQVISKEDPNEEYGLSQNYPNPFNPRTTIEYKIPKDEFVKLTVYDITGRVVKELVNGYKAAGMYNVEFDASSHASGTYFYKLEAEDYKSIQKMMVVK